MGGMSDTPAMDLEALAALLVRMHDGRWQLVDNAVVLHQPGSIGWHIRGYESQSGLQLVLHWAPNSRASGAHEMRLHLEGSTIEIVQQVMARVAPLQRAVQLGFDEGMRSWQQHMETQAS